MTLKGKTVLLTGASGGIGREIARRLVQREASVILVGRSASKLNSLAAELNIGRRGGYILAADIATHEGLEKIRTALNAMHHPLDILINCAGTNQFAFLEDMSCQSIATQVTTNVTATIQLTHLALPFLNKSGARILNIGSSFGGLGYPGFSVYCATKFALRGFSEALRRELAQSNVQVGYLAPRATKTELNSDAVSQLNQALGNHVDDPVTVATCVEKMLLAKKMKDRNIGWPERLFLRLNSVFPRLIDMALKGQLSVITQYAKTQVGERQIGERRAGEKSSRDEKNISAMQ